MYNTNSLCGNQTSFDLDTQMKINQLINNTSMMAMQLSTSNFISAMLNQQNMSQMLSLNSFPVPMNTNKDLMTQLTQNCCVWPNMAQNALNVPPAAQPATQMENLELKSQGSLTKVEENPVGTFTMVRKNVTLRDESCQESSQLTKSRSNTTCTLEIAAESPDAVKPASNTLCKDTVSDSHSSTEDDEKPADQKMIGSNDDVAENGIVFSIRRLNKKTNKYVLLTKHRKIITKCSHTDAEYYAKGMCKKCYHNKGERSKFATKCDHSDRYHYARGLCKGCYLVEYHNKRKSKSS